MTHTPHTSLQKWGFPCWATSPIQVIIQVLHLYCFNPILNRTVMCWSAKAGMVLIGWFFSLASYWQNIWIQYLVRGPEMEEEQWAPSASANCAGNIQCHRWQWTRDRWSRGTTQKRAFREEERANCRDKADTDLLSQNEHCTGIKPILKHRDSKAPPKRLLLWTTNESDVIFSLYVLAANIMWPLLYKLKPKAGWSWAYLWQVQVRVGKKRRTWKGEKRKQKQSQGQKHLLPTAPRLQPLAVSSRKSSAPPDWHGHILWLLLGRAGHTQTCFLTSEWGLLSSLSSRMGEKHIRVEKFADKSQNCFLFIPHFVLAHPCPPILL